MSRIATFAAPGIGCSPVSHRRMVRFVVSNNSASASCVMPIARLADRNSLPVISAHRRHDGAQRHGIGAGPLRDLLRRLASFRDQIGARRDVCAQVDHASLPVALRSELKGHAIRVFAAADGEIGADVHLFHEDNLSSFGIGVNRKMS